MREKFLKIIPILLLVVVIFNFSSIILADNLETIFNPENIPGRDENNTIANVDKSVKGIWSTIVLVLQVLSVTAFIFAGVRYMFSSADTRANIKVQIVWLLVGSLFVFASTTIINFVTTTAGQILKVQ